jgi:hypothetical protein
MRWGEEYPAKRDLSSLRLLGSVGEPINPKAWLWYHAVIGGERCPVVDTWWQTETGAIMITTLPGLVPAKPGSAGLSLPGVSAALVDESGGQLQQGNGYLALTRPWPSMLRTLHNDPDRYAQTYFARFGPSTYFAGDGARRDQDGYFWITGRADDVIIVSRSPAVDRRDRIGSRLAPGGGGGGGDRRRRRTDRPVGGGLRHPELRCRARAGSRSQATRVRLRADRQAGQAEPGHLGPTTCPRPGPGR